MDNIVFFPTVREHPGGREPPALEAHPSLSILGVVCMGESTQPQTYGVCVCVSLMLEVSGGFQTACRRIGFGNVC